MCARKTLGLFYAPNLPLRPKVAKQLESNHRLNWWFAPSPGRAYYRQPLKRHRKVCQSHFFYRPPLKRPAGRPFSPGPSPRLSGARRARAEGGTAPPCLPPGASTRSAATRGRASAGGVRRPRRPSRLPGEGGPHGRPRGPPIGGRLAGRPICCQQRWHRRRERAEALTRRTIGPSPMGSSPGRSSRPDTPRRPARSPRPLWAYRRAGGHARGSGNSCTG